LEAVFFEESFATFRNNLDNEENVRVKGFA
jgi:hypothetical protein